MCTIALYSRTLHWAQTEVQANVYISVEKYITSKWSTCTFSLIRIYSVIINTIAFLKYIQVQEPCYERSIPKCHRIPTPFPGRVTTSLPVGTEPIWVVELTESIDNA
ncbi:hypothetical protein T10_12222 [Trichinella papuae]|uniref:Uncharacterized protein n=1 Tax=Trichinella papuae TaxID=268474 RepID=A0A0V1M3U8_9BILA|nr:hypothetical protein T10_12222 [Trichinella papuae]